MIQAKLLVCLASIFLLSACAKGPESKVQLATQGLLSGAISDDGEYAVVGSVHHGGSLWDAKKGERLYDWNHATGKFSSLRAVAISGDGKVAVTCEEDAMVVWDRKAGESKAFWQAPDRILTIKLNEDGSKALVGTRKGQVLFFDLKRGSVIQSFEHEAEVRAVDLNADATIGISGSDDRTAKVWDLKSGKEIDAMTLENLVKNVAISPSGEKAFITSLREDAIVWEPQSGKKLFSLPNRYTNYTAATFSEDENRLTVGTFQGKIKSYQIKGGQELGSWQAEPRKQFGGASSKAIIDVVDANTKVLAVTSDGLFQTFVN